MSIINLGNFKREEFACKCGCGFAAVDVELLVLLQGIREHFKSPVIINSACRCERHNAEEGGKRNSYHIKGMAADIVVKGVNPHLVAEYMLTTYPNKYGVGNYATFTHVDVREGSARWATTAS